MINKTSYYIIKAVTEMARLGEDSVVGVKALAERIDVPTNYLGKSLRTLARKGMIRSYKGKGGGFAIRKTTLKRPLIEIVEAVDDLSRWSKCFLNYCKCNDSSPCSLHEEWKSVRTHYLFFLQSNTIQDCM